MLIKTIIRIITHLSQLLKLKIMTTLNACKDTQKLGYSYITGENTNGKVRQQFGSFLRAKHVTTL